jgi:hypothetical protein
VTRNTVSVERMLDPWGESSEWGECSRWEH